MKGSKAVTSESTYDVSAQIGHFLRRAYQRHMALFQGEVPESTLTMVQFVALCGVRDLEAGSLNDLVKKTAIDQATIRGVVERLIAKGLVSTKSDENDARKRLILLTDEGRALLTEVIPAAQKVTELTYGSLSPAERVALQYLLVKISAD